MEAEETLRVRADDVAGHRLHEIAEIPQLSGGGATQRVFDGSRRWAVFALDRDTNCDSGRFVELSQQLGFQFELLLNSAHGYKCNHRRRGSAGFSQNCPGFSP